MCTASSRSETSERFAQPLFQCGVQLFVHGPAHLVEPGAVVGLQQLQPLVDGGAHFGQAALVDLDQPLQLLAETSGEPGQRFGGLGAGGLGVAPQAGAQLVLGLPQLRAQGAGRLRQFAAQAALALGDVGAQRALGAFQPFQQRVQAGGSGGRAQAGREAKQAG